MDYKSKSDINSDYLPISKPMHLHDHINRPHLHSSECDRLISGYDKDRHKRFYFTTNLTPVRCYVSYSKTISSIKKDLNDYNGNQVPKNTLLRLGISHEYINEVTKFIFSKETCSFTPRQIDKTPKTKNKSRKNDNKLKRKN